MSISSAVKPSSAAIYRLIGMQIWQRVAQSGVPWKLVGSDTLNTRAVFPTPVLTVLEQFTYNLFIISIQPLGQFGQEPEPSQATGMALVRCILDKFWGVVCHCFPPYVHYTSWIKNLFSSADSSRTIFVKYLLTHLLTHSIQHSPSWEANWFCS